MLESKISEKEAALGYKISEKEAIRKLKEIGEQLEVKTGTKDFKDVIEELIIPMRKENFSYDNATRSFNLVLFDTIDMRDESGETISMVTIRKTTMDEKKELQRYKENQKIESATHMIALATGLDIGFISRLKEKDTSRINAVIMGFFV